MSKMTSQVTYKIRWQTLKRSLVMVTICLLLPVTLCQIDGMPMIPMSEFAADYRPLDCWQCFEAEGRMCRHKGLDHLEHLTGTTHKRYGICCKKDAHDGQCADESADIECSMSSHHGDSSSAH